MYNVVSFLGHRAHFFVKLLYSIRKGCLAKFCLLSYDSFSFADPFRSIILGRQVIVDSSGDSGFETQIRFGGHELK